MITPPFFCVFVQKNNFKKNLTQKRFTQIIFSRKPFFIPRANLLAQYSYSHFFCKIPAPRIDLLHKSILPGVKCAIDCFSTCKLPRIFNIFCGLTKSDDLSYKTNIMFSASAQEAAFAKRKRRGAGPRARIVRHKKWENPKILFSMVFPN